VGLARCGTVFSVSAVVGAAVPAECAAGGCARVLMRGGVSRRLGYESEKSFSSEWPTRYLERGLDSTR